MQTPSRRKGSASAVAGLPTIPARDASAGRLAGHLLEQLLEKRFDSHDSVAHPETPFQRSRNLLGKLLADAFGATPLAAGADGVGGRSKDALHLEAPAFPTAAGTLPDSSPLRSGSTIVTLASLGSALEGWFGLGIRHCRHLVAVRGRFDSRSSVSDFR